MKHPKTTIIFRQKSLQSSSTWTTTSTAGTISTTSLFIMIQCQTIKSIMSRSNMKSIYKTTIPWIWMETDILITYTCRTRIWIRLWTIWKTKTTKVLWKLKKNSMIKGSITSISARTQACLLISLMTWAHKYKLNVHLYTTMPILSNAMHVQQL